MAVIFKLIVFCLSTILTFLSRFFRVYNFGINGGHENRHGYFCEENMTPFTVVYDNTTRLRLFWGRDSLFGSVYPWLSGYAPGVG